MDISIPHHVVVFDYGEVISHVPTDEDRARVLALAGVEAELFWPAYWRHRPDLDLGRASIVQYWRRIARDLHREWDASLIQELWIADLRGWMSINAEVFRVIDRLKNGGTRLALLSNAGPDYGGFYRHGPLSEYFEAFIISGEIDVIKPDPAIYRHALDALKIAPEQMIFIDDRVENIAAAAELGIHGHHFADAAALTTYLEAFSANHRL